jgi:tetratricopeptide (TPR) repeat protein
MLLNIAMLSLQAVVWSRFAIGALPDSLWVRGQIQPNHWMEPEVLSWTNAVYLEDLWNRWLYPEIDLVAVFRMGNTSSDTVKLAEDGVSLLKYLRMEYLPPDTSRGYQPIAHHYRERFSAPQDTGEVPFWLHSNVIAPRAAMEVDALVLWRDLAEIPAGRIYFRWVFNNSAAAARDSAVTPAYWEMPAHPLGLKKQAENRLDSLYFMNMQAQVLNAQGKLDSSISLCRQILELDNSDLLALRTLSEMLWKLEKFDEAIAYVRRALDLIHLRGDVNLEYYVWVMQDRLYRLERREKWPPPKRVYF